MCISLKSTKKNNLCGKLPKHLGKNHKTIYFTLNTPKPPSQYFYYYITESLSTL